MEEKFEEKVFEYKLKSLIEQRTMLSSMIVILSGGITWLVFLDAPNYKYLFIVFGIYVACIFVNSLMSTILELNRILYKKQAGDK